MTTLEFISAYLAALAFRVPLSFEAALAPGQAPRSFWAGRWYREKDQYQNFHSAIPGPTRAGKSILVTLYVRSILPTLYHGSDKRFILFDPKNELHPMLFVDAKVPVHFALVSDMRNSRWDVARDCKSPADVTELFNTMIPENPAEKDKFFRQTLRELSGGAISSLNVTHPRSWDLADFVRIMECRWALEQVLGRTYGTRHLLRYMNEPRLWANIEATIATELNPLRIIAA